MQNKELFEKCKERKDSEEAVAFRIKLWELWEMLEEAIHFMTTDHKYKNTKTQPIGFFQHNPLSGGHTVIVAWRDIFQYFILAGER